METTYIFKGGQTVHTIWGEEVILEKLFDPDFIYTLTFRSKHLGYVFSITKHGLRVFDDPETIIIYPHPVRVTPIPEFEEGEEYEFSIFSDFPEDHTFRASYLFKSKDGLHYCQHMKEELIIDAFNFCRKITKPEKTRTELMEELIEKLSWLSENLWNLRHVSIDSSSYEKEKQARAEISSLQEQIKQKS